MNFRRQTAAAVDSHVRAASGFRLAALSGVHVIGGDALAVLDGDQLREDADGDLLRRDGADVEADRRVHALEEFGRHLRRSVSAS